MNESIQLEARKYLAEPTGSLWRWTPDGDGVQWSNFQTIAFADEVVEILSHQRAGGARGLPPLGAVLWLVAAMRNNWSNDANSYWRRNQLENIISLKFERLLEEVVEGLDQIHALAPEHRSSLIAKQTLVDVVFEKSPRTTALVGTEVLRLLSNGIEEFFTNPQDLAVPDVSNVLITDFRSLKQGLSQVDSCVDRLLLRRETGVDEIPLAEFVEIPEDPSPSELFSDLESDSELYVLGRAARQLYSVLSLPQPSFAESELQQGGVSDIANRGPLDRLLLSELAHDDLTLAVRVAVNEAMYLRRESPPQNQQRRQIIVLDCGLRSWGMPRLIGAAIGMALVARAGDSVQPSVYCPNMEQLEPVSLSRRESIMAHLKTLRPELDLTGSLPAVDALLSDGEAECDLILVTNDATAESNSLSLAINRSKILSNSKLSRLFIGSVAHDGETKLIEVNGLGRKPIKQLTLDRGRLTENAPKRNSSRGDDGLPAFFGLERMPLRLSYNQIKEDFVWPIGPDRLIMITGDGRLLYYNSDKFGGEQLSDRIAPAKVWWFSLRASAGVWSAVIGNQQSGKFRILTYDEKTAEVAERPLEVTQGVIGFCSHQGSLFVLYRDQVAIVDQKSGAIGKRLGVKTDSWRSGRFFATSQDFYALSVGGKGFEPVLEKIETPITGHQNATFGLHILESENVEGPVVLDVHEGEMFFLASDARVVFQTKSISSLREFSLISFDPFLGLAFLIGPNFQCLIVDVRAGTAQIDGNRSGFLKRRVDQLTNRQQQLRRRFSSISVLSDGAIRLASRNQPRLEFDVRNKCLLLEEAVVRPSTPKRTFQRATPHPNKRYDLQVAHWEDGSEAWLDGRGLLHLRSSNADIPELTLTLSHGPCSGWCSDGELFGLPFFIGDLATNKPVEDVLQIMKRFGEHIVNSC